MAQFGTVFCDHISVARFENGSWGDAVIEPLAPLPMHPASHVLHYASTCFEGFKAYRWQDGRARVFRLHDHIARMQRSAASMRLPVPDADMLAAMVIDLVSRQLDDIPDPPSALYLRPTLIGTTPNIGAAAAPSRCMSSAEILPSARRSSSAAVLNVFIPPTPVRGRTCRSHSLQPA